MHLEIDNITVIVENNCKPDEVIIEIRIPSPDMEGEHIIKFIKFYVIAGEAEDYVKMNFGSKYKLINVDKNFVKKIGVDK